MSQRLLCVVGSRNRSPQRLCGCPKETLVGADRHELDSLNSEYRNTFRFVRSGRAQLPRHKNAQFRTQTLMPPGKRKRPSLRFPHLRHNHQLKASIATVPCGCLD